MQELYTPCAGLDVPKKFGVACRVHPDAQGQPDYESRKFATMLANLEALQGWWLVATKHGAYPHHDDGVDVRRVCHKLRSLAMEHFNEYRRALAGPLGAAARAVWALLWRMPAVDGGEGRRYPSGGS